MSSEAPPGGAGAEPLQLATGQWGHTSIAALWVPVLVFAHAYAAFWLYRAWRLNAPPAKRQCWARAAFEEHVVPKLGARARRLVVRAKAGPESASQSGSPLTLQAADCLADGTGLERAPSSHAVEISSREVSRDDEDDVEDLDWAAAPGAPASLEWRGLGCSYTTPAGPKAVLADVWGAARPGEMQALLGPSGAGKSTLMDILALRKSMGTLTGRLLVDGAPASKRFVRMTAYVPQDDNFVPTMTAMETLRFYAEITLPRGEWDAARRRQRIEEVLAEVGLSHAAATIVGGTLPGGLMLRGLSGGERKRLSVATGILAAPRFIFLDEPTSGLDSFAALSVMGYLKRLAREQGRVVIASIHQPRSAIWQMFDAVTLLANGRLMYGGPRDGMTAWFGGLGYAYDPDLHGVPSDWALDLVAIGFAKPARFYGHTITTREELEYAAGAFKAQYLRDAGLQDSDADCPPPAKRGARGSGGGSAVAVVAASGGAVALAAAEEGAAGEAASDAAASDAAVSVAAPRRRGAGAAVAGAWGQFRTLLWRELLAITRNPFDVAGRTLTFAWVGVFMGLLTYGTAPDAASMQSRVITLEMTLCFYLLMPYISISLYTADKKFVLADASSKLYRPLAYYLAKVVAVTPFQIVTALVYGFVVYGMAGLRPGAEAIFKNALVCTLMHLIASQVLHAAAVAAPNQDTSFMISITWTAVQMLLSGFFVDFRRVYLSWMTELRFISAVHYAFEAVMRTEFGGLELPCTGKGTPGGFDQWIAISLPDTSSAQRSALARVFASNAGASCRYNPGTALDEYGMQRTYGQSIGILIGYLLVLHVVTFFAMVLSTRHERR